MRRETLLIFSLTIFSIFFSGYLIVSKTNDGDSHTRPVVIIRMDDIADYFKQPQIELMKIHNQHNISVSIGVISSHLNDIEVISLYNQNDLVEVCLHGWEHENHTSLSYDAQELLILKGKNKLESVFDADVSVFIPPLYEYNDDTIDVLEMNGFSTISSYLDDEYDGSGIVDFPVTVEYSRLFNGSWVERDVDVLVYEIGLSVEERGYAVIGTHPQEFFNGDQVDYEKLEKYQEFLVLLSSSFHLGHFQELSIIKVGK